MCCNIGKSDALKMAAKILKSSVRMPETSVQDKHSYYVYKCNETTKQISIIVYSRRTDLPREDRKILNLNQICDELSEYDIPLDETESFEGKLYRKNSEKKFYEM